VDNPRCSAERGSRAIRAHAAELLSHRTQVLLRLRGVSSPHCGAHRVERGLHSCLQGSAAARVRIGVRTGRLSNCELPVTGRAVVGVQEGTYAEDEGPWGSWEREPRCD
jgi:hypothetical protein